MRSVIVAPEDSGQRLDKYLFKYLNTAPASFIYKALRKKDISLNGKKADPCRVISAGDEIRLFFSDEKLDTLREGSSLKNEPAHDNGNVRRNAGAPVLDPECIIYEDNDLILVNKPRGILSQKAEPGDISMNELLLDHVARRKDLHSGNFTPSVCNRLDRNTTGIMCFALNYAAARQMNELISERSVRKYYYALVKGMVKDASRFRARLVKDASSNTVTVLGEGSCTGDLIETAVFPEAFGTDCTLLSVELITGKTHQIRAHLSSLGHPVFGDPKYGDPVLNGKLRSQYGIRSQLLHSFRLVMPEITEGPLKNLSGKSFSAPLPSEFGYFIR